MALKGQDQVASTQISMEAYEDQANWADGSVEFTVTEAGTYTVGFNVSLWDGGWGNVDDVRLTVKSEDVDDPAPTVPVTSYDLEPVEGLSADFMRGVDVSSVISLEQAGVKYYDSQGVEKDIFQILAESGVNYVRIRIWNDPYDAKGNGYGGGNNDVAKAVEMGKRVTQYGMKVYVDFHYSDFWTSPAEQQIPKAWKGMTLAQQKTSLAKYTKDTLNKMLDEGIDVGMVQVGNETNQFLMGHTEWSEICGLFNAGLNAIDQVNAERSLDIAKMIHFAGSARSKLDEYAAALEKYGCDYDVLGMSWYPFWHGSLTTTKATLKTYAEKYGKQIMIVESSQAYMLDDTDGHPNKLSAWSNYDNERIEWDYSVGGQAKMVRDVIAMLNDLPNGLGTGYCYWEPAWITVGNTQGLTGSAFDARFAANQKLWEKYGCGWASSFAQSYDGRSGLKYFGGSSWDNQAMFDVNGKELDSLDVFKYVYTGAKASDKTVTSVEAPTISLTVGVSDFGKALPQKVKVNFSDGTSEWLGVSWLSGAWDKYNDLFQKGTVGTYKLRGFIYEKVGLSYGTTVWADLIIGNGSNEGFESDLDGWEFEGAGYDMTTTDVHSGKKALHFWLETAEDGFTVSQTVKLSKAGIYQLSAFVQGGLEADGTSNITLWFQREGKPRMEIPVSLDGYLNWNNPILEFGSLGGDDEVTVGMTVTGSAGTWGTIDDVNLVRKPSGTLSFSKNGATGVKGALPAKQLLASGEGVTIPKNIYSTNRFFRGWNTSATGKGTAYAAGSVYTAGSTNKVLYAQWAKTYTASNKLTYMVNGDKTVKVYKYAGKASKVTIPTSIKVSGITYKVTAVSAKAFYGNKYVTTVTVGSNVKTVGSYAFAACPKLKYLSLGTGVTSIGSSLCSGCAKRATVVFKTKRLKTVGGKINAKKCTMTIKVPASKKTTYKKLLKVKYMTGTITYKGF